MGCFSFKCLKCGRAIKSNSFVGERCHLFLLKDGEVIQKMLGDYDSYGRVFVDEVQGVNEWNDPLPDKALDEHESERFYVWHRVTDLMGSDNFRDGIAALHDKCFDGTVPVIRSPQDPDQGWGSVKEPPIPDYDPMIEHVLQKAREDLWNLKRLKDSHLSFRELIIKRGIDISAVKGKDPLENIENQISTNEQIIAELAPIVASWKYEDGDDDLGNFIDCGPELR